MTVARPISRFRAKMARALRQGAQAPAGSSTHLTSAERWQIGYDAFIRGEIPPSDSDEAEGWYWAENEAARGR